MQEKILYKNPTKDDVPYWVPMTVKNKDRMIGILDGIGYMLIYYDVPTKDTIDIFLDSTRFSDIVDENGTHALNLTDREVRKLMGGKRIRNKENGKGIIKPSYLNLSCSCGNFYSFKSPDEIPETNLICGICDRIIIEYNGHEDYDYIDIYKDEDDGQN